MLRRLSISNFKSVKTRDYYFDRGLTLIKGPSGAGKTTIFEAIRYALFGGSLRDTKSRESKKSKVVLELTINGSHMIITRERGRDLITLVIDSKQFKGKEAQSLIEKYFGNEETWISSSYLIQGTHHEMLSTPKYREELLLNILFTSGEITPKYIRDKLREFKKNIEKDIEVIKRTIDSRRTYRPVKIKSFSRHNLPKDVLIYQRNLLVKGREIISQTRIPSQHLKDFIQIVRTLGSKRVKDIIETLSHATTASATTASATTACIADTQSSSKDINVISELPDPDLIKRLELLFMHKDRELITYCTTLLCSDKESIQAILQILKQYSESEINKILSFDETKLSDKVQALIQHTNSDTTSLVKSVLEYEEGIRYINKLGIKDIDEYIRNLESRESKSMTCPKCNSKLLLISRGTDLILELAPPFTNPHESSLNKDLVSQSPSPMQSKELLQKLKHIRSLKDPGVSSSEIQNHLNALSKKKLLDTLKPLISKVSKGSSIESAVESAIEIEIRKLISGIPIFHFLLNNFTSKELKFISTIKDLDAIKKYNALHDWNKYMSYPAEKAFISVLSNIDIIDRTLNSNKSIEELDREIAEFEEEEEEKEQLKFNTKWEEIQSLKKKLSAVESLIQIVDEAEKEHIKDFIDCLNYYLQFILSRIFKSTDDIESSKSIENSKSSSAGCNIVIDMKEIVLNYGNTPDVRSLSGGEKDRVSFALLWSLHQIRKTGFILLDECFSSIDNELKKRCFEILKKFDSETQVLCILHDVEEDIQEMFDNVIEVKP